MSFIQITIDLFNNMAKVLSNLSYIGGNVLVDFSCLIEKKSCPFIVVNKKLNFTQFYNSMIRWGEK